MIRLLFFVAVTLLRSTAAFDLRECSRPLSIASGRIEDARITASSSFDAQSTGPQNARLHSETGGGAWCPSTQINASSHEWIQVEFPALTVVSAVETQGRWDRGRGLEYPPAYMIEYWRDSLGQWARYKDGTGNEIIEGNTDTRSALRRILSGGIVAKLVRIIPVSEVTRTVCLRFELYGCPQEEPILSYSMPDGALSDGLDLRDASYDGARNQSGHLSGGLGKLFDGVVGENNFEQHPKLWVGWRNAEHGAPVTIVLDFASKQNITSISFHASNNFKHGAQVFQQATVEFAQSPDGPYSPRTIEFDYLPDRVFDNVRWVRIPVPHRLATKVRLTLHHAQTAEWLLLSEIQVASANATVSTGIRDLSDARLLDVEPDLDGNTLTYFAVDNSESEEGIRTVIYVVGFLSVVIGLLSVALLVRLLCSRRRPGNAKTVPSFYDRPPKCITPSDKRMLVSTYQVHTNNFENCLLQKPTTSAFDAGNEYAEPDIDSLAEPLLKQNSNEALPSMRYAASDLFGPPQYPTMAFSSASTSSCRSVPASPNRQYMKLACNRPAASPTGIPPIDPAELDFVESLGTGEFAHVDLCRFNGRLVAVKYLRDDVSGDTVAGFRGELIALSRLHHHNVIRVIGTCTPSGGAMAHASIVMEYMRNGDLCHYLKRQGTMRFDQLLSIASQIAAGMAYLESVHFVHRDLACRNCLVDADGTVKIADFGMARSLYNSDYYHLDGKAVLPIRWMAWECLLRGEFTTKSDVWALGVTLWEVFDACRQKPFAELADEDVIGNLEHMFHSGNLKVELPPPRHCPSNAFMKVLKPCWRREPAQRPSSADIHLELQNLTRMLAQ